MVNVLSWLVVSYKKSGKRNFGLHFTLILLCVTAPFYFGRISHNNAFYLACTYCSTNALLVYDQTTGSCLKKGAARFTSVAIACILGVIAASPFVLVNKETADQLTDDVAPDDAKADDNWNASQYGGGIKWIFCGYAVLLSALWCWVRKHNPKTPALSSAGLSSTLYIANQIGTKAGGASKSMETDLFISIGAVAAGCLTGVLLGTCVYVFIMPVSARSLALRQLSTVFSKLSDTLKPLINLDMVLVDTEDLVPSPSVAWSRFSRYSSIGEKTPEGKPKIAVHAERLRDIVDRIWTLADEVQQIIKTHDDLARAARNEERYYRTKSFHLPTYMTIIDDCRKMVYHAFAFCIILRARETLASNTEEYGDLTRLPSPPPGDLTRLPSPPLIRPPSSPPSNLLSPPTYDRTPTLEISNPHIQRYDRRQSVAEALKKSPHELLAIRHNISSGTMLVTPEPPNGLLMQPLVVWATLYGEEVMLIATALSKVLNNLSETCSTLEKIDERDSLQEAEQAVTRMINQRKLYFNRIRHCVEATYVGGSQGTTAGQQIISESLGIDRLGTYLSLNQDTKAQIWSSFTNMQDRFAVSLVHLLALVQSVASLTKNFERFRSGIVNR